jgi:hypothetical protein
LERIQKRGVDTMRTGQQSVHRDDAAVAAQGDDVPADGMQARREAGGGQRQPEHDSRGQIKARLDIEKAPG